MKKVLFNLSLVLSTFFFFTPSIIYSQLPEVPDDEIPTLNEIFADSAMRSALLNATIYKENQIPNSDFEVFDSLMTEIDLQINFLKVKQLLLLGIKKHQAESMYLHTQQILVEDVSGDSLWTQMYLDEDSTLYENIGYVNQNQIWRRVSIDQAVIQWDDSGEAVICVDDPYRQKLYQLHLVNGVWVSNQKILLDEKEQAVIEKILNKK